MAGYTYLGQPIYGGVSYGGYNIPQMNYGQTPAPPGQPQMQNQGLPKTNKIFVTSLNDALSRPADYNSSMVYFHQDQPLIYEIITDAFGKKTPHTYPVGNEITDSNGSSIPSNTISPDMTKTFATKEELKALSDKIDALYPTTPKNAKAKPAEGDIE